MAFIVLREDIKNIKNIIVCFFFVFFWGGVVDHFHLFTVELEHIWNSTNSVEFHSDLGGRGSAVLIKEKPK